MRLRVAVNDSDCWVASVPGVGFLSASLHLTNMEKVRNKRQLTIGGSQYLEAESIGFEWPKVELKIGDTVHLNLMPEGPGDLPVKQETRCNIPDELLTDMQFAEKVVALCESFETGLAALLADAAQFESPEECERLAAAIKHATSSVDCFLKDPICSGPGGR